MRVFSLLAAANRGNNVRAREFHRLAGGLAAGLLLASLWAGGAEGAPRFNALQIAPEGAEAPRDFAFPDLAGKVRRLADARGKVVLLAFFATWCPLCHEEMPKIARLYEKYKERGFTVVAVSIDQAGADFVRRWVEERKLGYPVLHDQGFASRTTHNVRFVPTLYLLGRDLRLAAWAIGSVDWEGQEAAALLERLLAAKPSASRARLPY